MKAVLVQQHWQQVTVLYSQTGRVDSNIDCVFDIEQSRVGVTSVNEEGSDIELSVCFVAEENVQSVKFKGLTSSDPRNYLNKICIVPTVCNENIVMENRIYFFRTLSHVFSGTETYQLSAWW